MDHVRIEWQEYRQAFDQFSRSVRLVQGLTANPNTDRVALDAALLELEKARGNYDICRDALAQKLMPEPARRDFAAVQPETDEIRVKSVAQLLWEAAGRPDGSAEEDWHRAEEIVRQSREASLTTA